MAKTTGLLSLIKIAAQEAVEASDPTDIIMGEVITESPLEIQLDQKMILGSEFLTLSQNVTDYEALFTPKGGTQQQITLHRALKQGDIVLLAMTKGGQNYIVLDRIAL